MKIYIRSTVMEKMDSEVAYLRVGVDCFVTPDIYDNVTLIDKDGLLPPRDALVTGIKDNSDYRFGNRLTSIVRLHFNADIEEDKLIFYGSEYGWGGGNLPGNNLYPGSAAHTPSDAGTLRSRNA